MITYQEIAAYHADFYDSIEKKVDVNQIYDVVNGDLKGISFERKNVKPYIKDFAQWDRYSRWRTQFNIENWYIIAAFDGEVPIGGAVLVYDTPQCNMLSGRDDLGVLWDIRVDSRYKHQGVGQQLFDLVKEKAAAFGLCELKIECQNVNVAAVNFYLKQGAHIGAIDRYAYYGEKDIEDEVQLLLYLKL